jgi:hypothetical protein
MSVKSPLHLDGGKAIQAHTKRTVRFGFVFSPSGLISNIKQLCHGSKEADTLLLPLPRRLESKTKKNVRRGLGAGAEDMVAGLVSRVHALWRRSRITCARFMEAVSYHVRTLYGGGRMINGQGDCKMRAKSTKMRKASNKY